MCQLSPMDSVQEYVVLHMIERLLGINAQYQLPDDYVLDKLYLNNAHYVDDIPLRSMSFLVYLFVTLFSFVDFDFGCIFCAHWECL